jgi:phospholipid/cholesterol/gamma-HCH transport system substrate-binding protein
VRRAVREHLVDLAAIAGLVAIAVAVAATILGHQRFAAPGWVPWVGEDTFHLEAEMSSAQSVAPGQGQTVDVAGVPVGEITSVRLEDGRAVIGMDRDATVLLRPRTALRDMVAELTPGHPAAGRLPDGGRIPVAQTLPDVNLDEILAVLDRDTRDYLRLLLAGGAEGLGGRRGGRALGQVVRRIEPTAAYARRLSAGLAERRRHLRRVVHAFGLVTEALGRKDTQLGDFVETSNAVFASLAKEDASLRATLRALPGTLERTRAALGRLDRLGGTLGPTLEGLRPGARALGGALRRTRPFLRATTPVIRDELRPFAREALPTVRELQPATRRLAAATPDLTRVLGVVDRLLNELAYNPPGRGQEGYLFWLAWASHVSNALFATQDAHGPVRRGLVVLSCNDARLLRSVADANPLLGTLVDLLNAPGQEEICPPLPGAPVAPTAAASARESGR